MERAEVVLDKTERKVERGVGRRKGGRERKVSGWVCVVGVGVAGGKADCGVCRLLGRS